MHAVARQCTLCKSDRDNDVKYGDFVEANNVFVHTFCLYLSSNLAQRGADNEGIMGFLLSDIKKESQRTRRLYCCYCNKCYSNIGCCEPKCRRTFHMVCGMDNGVENQFVGTYNSYCNYHAHKVKYRPAADEMCCICYDSLWANDEGSSKAKKPRFDAQNMIRAPCCHNGWFHKLCLQKFARNAGYFFKCPLCNDKDKFCEKLPYKGIFIPNRDATWELEPHAYEELLERPSRCSSEQCQNRHGREENADNNPLLTCSTCGSVAMHKLCMTSRSHSFQCSDCAKFLKSDSGHESLQSQNGEQQLEDDDVEVDVCHNSDSSEAFSTREASYSRDQSTDDAVVKRSSSCGRNLKRRLVSSSDDSDEGYNKKLAHGLTSDDEIGPHGKTTDSSCSDGSQEVIALSRRSQNKSRRIFDEVEDANSRSVTPVTVKEDCFSKNSAKDSSSAEEAVDGVGGVDDSEDPLENFDIYLKRKAEKLQSVNSPKDHVLTTSASTSRQASSADSDAGNSMEVSCIAGRTRRRSHNVGGAPNEQVSVPSDRPYGKPHDISCIAVRTRGRQIMPVVSDDTSNARSRSSSASTTARHKLELRQRTSFDLNNLRRRTAPSVTTNADTSAPKVSSALELSCIANRTRRKSLHGRSVNRIYSTSDSTDNDDNGQDHPYSLSPKAAWRGSARVGHSDTDSACSYETALTKISHAPFKNQRAANGAPVLNTSCVANRTRRKSVVKSTHLCDIVEADASPANGSMAPSTDTCYSRSPSTSAQSHTVLSHASDSSSAACSSVATGKTRLKAFVKRTTSTTTSTTPRINKARRISSTSNDADDDDDVDDDNVRIRVRKANGTSASANGADGKRPATTWCAADEANDQHANANGAELRRQDENPVANHNLRNFARSYEILVSHSRSRRHSQSERGNLKCL